MTADGTPLTVIGGYLGAGKTTLLNHLLRNAEGRRIAIVVNDFGDINIDADLVESNDGQTIALANGCICCTLVDSLATALTDLRGRTGNIDHVVVEASGVSDPVKIGHYGAAFGFALQSVIVLADAEQVRLRAADKYVGDTVKRQLHGADLLVLNKTDLVDAAELASVHHWLVDLVPAARMINARDADIPVPFLLGPPRDGGWPVITQRNRQPESVHPAYDSWSFESSEPLARADVEGFLAQLPPEVLRAKGFVCLDEDPDNSYLLQVVGRRSTLTPHHGSKGASFTTRLILVGLPGSIDGERYEQLLRGNPARRDPKPGQWSSD